MKLVMFFLLGFLWISPSFAIIGETKEQCDARYGTPKVQKLHLSRYLKDGVEIDVTFENGKAALIYYNKVDAQGTRIHFKESEVLSILQSNGGKKKWQEAKWSLPDLGWYTEDKTVFAIESMGGQLQLTNRDHASPLLVK